MPKLAKATAKNAIKNAIKGMVKKTLKAAKDKNSKQKMAKATKATTKAVKKVAKSLKKQSISVSKKATAVKTNKAKISKEALGSKVEKKTAKPGSNQLHTKVEVTKLSLKAAVKATSRDILRQLRAESASTRSGICREVACELTSTSGGYCRLHYIKNWKKIKRKELILKEKKLNHYIEELVSKYPDKYIEAIRNDLASEKEFSKVIADLEIEENLDEFELETESAEGIIDNIKLEFEDDGDIF